MIRSCLLSNNCTVGFNTRIFGSVLLSGVTVGSGWVPLHFFFLLSWINFATFLILITIVFRCKITNCVIGEGVTINDNCTLKECSVAARQRVIAKSTMQSENLGFSEVDFENLTMWILIVWELWYSSFLPMESFFSNECRPFLLARWVTGGFYELMGLI